MKKGQKNLRSASSVAIDITYCIGNVSRRSFVNTFLNFGKDKEHKLGTD